MSEPQTNLLGLLHLAYPTERFSLANIYDFNSLRWDPANAIPKPTLEAFQERLNTIRGTEAMRLLRMKRNALLTRSDIYTISDFPHPDSFTKEAWLSYRQALRDMTNTANPQLTPSYELDDASVVWPPKPT